jgi:hypothetical protein
MLKSSEPLLESDPRYRDQVVLDAVAGRYTTATVMASPRTAAATGDFVERSELTGLKTFVTSFAGHIAAEAAR